MRRKQTLNRKLALLFIGAILLLFSIQLLFMKNGTLLISTEIRNAARSNVMYLKSSLESACEKTYMQMEYILQNQAVRRLLVSSGDSLADYYSSIADVQSILRIMDYSNDLTKGIRLSYPELGIYVSSDPAYGYGRVTMEESEIKKQTIHSGIDLNLSDNQVIIRYSQYNYGRDKAPFMYIEAIMDMDEITAMLSSYNQYSNQNACMYRCSEQKLICSQHFSENINTTNIPISVKNSSDKVYEITDEANQCILVCCYSQALDATFIQFVAYQTLETIPRKLKLFCLLLGILSLIAVMFYLTRVNQIVSKPVHTLCCAFDELSSGRFDIHIKESFGSREYDLLGDRFNCMTQKLKCLIENNYEKEIRLQQSELKQLQMQINPHFLYNTYYQLSHMLRHSDTESRENAVKLAEYMGSYFQHITHKNSQEISLEEEYQHALMYLNIQQIRFSDYVEIEANPLPESWKTVQVPRLILQPILENTFKYGMIERTECLKVCIHYETILPNMLTILMEDNKSSITDEEISQINRHIKDDLLETDIHALSNIHKRLQIFFGEETGLQATRGMMGGLCIRMLIRKKGV